MSIKMSATEFRTKLLSLLDDVANGEEVEITKHGRTVARLVGARGSRSRLGSMAGLAMTADPDDELFSTGDHWEVED